MAGLKFFSDLKIAVRMAVGTGLILVLLTVVAAVAFFGLGGAKDDFAEYRRLARQASSAAIIRSDALAARLGFRTFQLKQTDESAEQVSTNVALAIKHSEEAIELFESEERRQQMAGAIDMLQRYQAAFTRITELRSQRDPLVAHLNEVGPGIEKNLTAIMESAHRDSDAAAAVGAGETLRSLMLALSR